MWQLQDLPGAPGTARQGSTRTIVSTNRGGKATQPRAPGHERPLAALSAAGHGRLSADSGAPGADVPPATPAGAPGHHCLSAALRAPGHGRPLATTTRAPGQHRLRATPIATAPVPAGLRRLRQAVLPRVPATPNTLTYPHSRPNTANYHAPYSQAPTHWLSHHTTQTNRAPYSPAAAYSQRGSTTYQVHPAIQVSPHPRSCSTAGTGFSLWHQSRAPPPARPPKTYPGPVIAPLHHVERGRE